jgi:hypothetical protein
MSTFWLKYSIFSKSFNKERIALLFFFALFILPVNQANATTVTQENQTFFNPNSQSSNESEDVQTIWKSYRKLTLNDDCLLCKKLKENQSSDSVVKIEKFSTLHKESPVNQSNIEDIARIISYESTQLNQFFKGKHVKGNIIVSFTFLSIPEKIKNRMSNELQNKLQCENSQCALDYMEIIDTNIDEKIIKEYNQDSEKRKQPRYLFLNNIQTPTYFKIIICWNVEDK